MPDEKAPLSEWTKWHKEVEMAESGMRMQILLLGPSPTQAVLNSAKNSKDFKLQSTEIVQLPELIAGQ